MVARVIVIQAWLGLIVPGASSSSDADEMQYIILVAPILASIYCYTSLCTDSRL